jgi:hypothetical protein
MAEHVAVTRSPFVPLRRRASVLAAVFVVLLALVEGTAAFATASAAENTATPRSGVLHITKECPHIDQGFCTITGSNLNAIDPGMNVVYTNLHIENGVVISDLFVDGPGNNDAYGHVDLTIATWSGPLTFSGGTGRFRGFHAAVTVTCDQPNGTPCSWDGTYSFTPPGHD